MLYRFSTPNKDIYQSSHPQSSTPVSSRKKYKPLDFAPPVPDDRYFFLPKENLDRILAGNVSALKPIIPVETKNRSKLGKRIAAGMNIMTLGAGLMYQNFRYGGLKAGLKSFLGVPQLLKGFDLRTGSFGMEPNYEMPLEKRPQLSVWTAELLDLLQNDEVLKYLVDLKRHAENFKSGDAQLDLFEFTKSRCGGNRDEAMRWIAVLFQDAASATQANYLETKYPEFPADTLMLLRDLNLSVSGIVRSGAFKLYSDSSISEPFNPWLYHFYSIAKVSHDYVAKKNDPYEAACEAFLTNLTYEYFAKFGPRETFFNELRSDQLSFSEKINRFGKAMKILFAGPKTIETNETTLQSIYLGYAGAFWGAGFTSDEILSYERFKAEFVPNPRGFVKSLFATKAGVRHN